MAATPLEQREARLRQLNQLLIPLLRAVRRYAGPWQAYLGRPLNPARLVVDSRYSTGVLVAELPGSHPLVVAVYSSAQESRPLSPGQLERRLQRLRGIVERLRGRLFVGGDLVYIVIAPRGATRGAAAAARRLGVHVARSPGEAARRLARYLLQRLRALLNRLRGRRVWGPVPLLATALAHLAKSMGAPVKPPDAAIALRAAETGGTLDPDTILDNEAPQPTT